MYIHTTTLGLCCYLLPRQHMTSGLSSDRSFPVLTWYTKVLQLNSHKYFEGKSPVMHFLYVSHSTQQGIKTCSRCSGKSCLKKNTHKKTMD